MQKSAISESKDYAFVPGGILWKLIDRTGFERKSLRFKIFLIVLTVLACWLPLAALCFFRGGWAQFHLLFIRDVATHVKFLFVLPILLLARHSISKRFAETIETFYDAKIINQYNREQFEKQIKWLLKWRNSVIVDVILIILVYYTLYVPETELSNLPDFYAPWVSQAGEISAAGWWYIVFSLPLLQLILYRWLYCIITWTIFLWKISKVDLNLSSLHPDGVGGIGFLNYTQLSLFPVALAFSALAAGGLSNLIIFSNGSIRDFPVLIISLSLFVLLLFILPLLVFIPLLARVKRKCFFLYSKDAWDFARAYEKELKDYYENGETRPDSSWHVDLIGSFEKTSSMRIILVDKMILICFVSAVILPFIPVVAQEIPLRDLITSILSKFFG